MDTWRLRVGYILYMDGGVFLDNIFFLFAFFKGYFFYNPNSNYSYSPKKKLLLSISSNGTIKNKHIIKTSYTCIQTYHTQTPANIIK